MRKVVTFLWLNDRAEEAAEFYVSLFEDARIVSKSYLTDSVAEMAGTQAGAVSSVDFELAGQRFTALNGGPMYRLTEAASILVACQDQDEIDRLWDALSEGGTVLSCGWLTDRFGVTWQIVPDNLDEMLRDPDPIRANRVAEAMLSMEGKLDKAALERAYRGQ